MMLAAAMIAALTVTGCGAAAGAATCADLERAIDEYRHDPKMSMDEALAGVGDEDQVFELLTTCRR